MLGSLQTRVGVPITLEGCAESSGKAIVAVDFSLDEGVTWTRRSTEGSVPGKHLNWQFICLPDRVGLNRLMVRTVNEGGGVGPVCDMVDFIVTE